ncbi:hypothetical protein [Permianibacter aggregans]|uniref:Uncharacterized protein n=1 Tax=Permianibacter aggregans TaxID=1510150 RepID=A0A4R6UJN6_9GAMM|nr:hypothetical protein [Permianibacter aggregans]QGX39733.1 hypothetical protein E2H98_08720 [Permianibacter aggregans]TDQ47148.1 hypothetical protein EV696_11176 [Permianibacter aggregans]
MAKAAGSKGFTPGNSAHECVFGYLYNFGYSRRGFEGEDGMGSQLISKLSGYPSTSSPTAAAHSLTHLALEICGWAQDPWEAVPHEDWINRTLGDIGKTVGLLLAKKDATCLDLANLIDEIFQFPKEAEAETFASASRAIREAIVSDQPAQANPKKAKSAKTVAAEASKPKKKAASKKKNN